ncbi:hypothetical protein MAM1_0044d03056 [Mucor ambiguus]|uniref:Uncharacterized protein n=1 Tax=Mucor ambiguus TaxID=91626 RepID=A0A0C9M3K9_9FUNG|nr:hypothetical protein MAM1_0044d03056 [Mucor ambiguus]
MRAFFQNLIMYFDETDANEWKLQDAFDEYYKSTNGSIERALECIKKDLQSFKKRPNMLSFAKTKAERLVTNWNKTRKKLAEYAPCSSTQDQVTESVSQNLIENNITNNDNARTSQVYRAMTVKKNTSAPGQTEVLAASIINNITNNNQSSTTQVYNTLTGKKRKTKERKEENFPNYQDQIKEWKIDDQDIGKAFQDYQISMAKEALSREFQVETDTHAILALTNILLIKHGQNDSTFDSHFTPNMMILVEESVQQKFDIIVVDSVSKLKKRNYVDMDSHVKAELENVIKSMLRKENSTKQTTKKINNLTTNESTHTPDDMLLLGVRNLIESIPLVKTKETVRESNLSCSYVHSVLNPLFTCPETNKFLVWSNIQMLPENSMQPDFVVNNLVRSRYSGPCVVGDIKGCDRQDDAYDCLVDLIRVGMMSVDSINKNEYDGVVGVHVVGMQLTFYITTLMANGLYVMLEICSIALPRDSTEIRSYVANMEDLLQVVQYYGSCTECVDPEWLRDNKKAVVHESLFLDLISCGKNKKRSCPIVLNH